MLQAEIHLEHSDYMNERKGVITEKQSSINIGILVQELLGNRHTVTHTYNNIIGFAHVLIRGSKVKEQF